LFVDANSRDFCNSGFRLRKIFSNDWEVMEVCEPKEILSFPATFRKTKGSSARMAKKENPSSMDN